MSNRQEIKPEWLLHLQKNLYKITLPASLKLWPIPNNAKKPFFNYRWEHVKQVEKDALYLTDKLNADREIILAAVWIHDRFQPAFSGKKHGQRAAQWAEHHLAKIGFPKNKVNAVNLAVKDHSAPPGVLYSKSLEARILWDADKLAHLGAFEIFVYILNNLAGDKLSEFNRKQTQGNAYGMPLYILKNTLIPFLNNSTNRDSFHFSISRRIAGERIKAQKIFIENLATQLQIRL